ncbi:DUF6418 domain-containing protein [Hoeflea sp.]|uniref:DUF6418 domain-containing protein n=1 Tax=Hoeflea sp. TaxID=1940281 RepID=UPI0019ABF651|nr:DUF6418 domain-containing protein [Hoeflea sp.]MBC7285438.1 hypothetical protein [Hoeflea sp.]
MAKPLERRAGPQARRPRERIQPRNTRAIVAMFLLHFLLAAAAAFGATIIPSAAWAYAALLIFCSFCVGLLRTSPATFLFFVPLLALRVTEFMSGAAIESGAYMVETAGYGHATGAFTRLLLIYLLFFAAATFVTEMLWPRLRRVFLDAPSRWEPQAAMIWYGLLIVAAITTIYLTWLGFTYGTPLFNDIDRFTYLVDVDSRFYNFFNRNRMVMVPLVGALFCVPAYRLRAIYLLIWLLAASIIFGEKFTSLVLILSTFAIPPGLVHVAHNRPIRLKQVGLIAGVIVAITVPAVLVAYGALEDVDAAAAKYGERVALQGQLWYRVDEQYLGRPLGDTQAIAADVATWLVPSAQDSQRVGNEFGLYYVMEKFTPTRTLGMFMESGNGFIFSLYPYLMLAFGITGMLIVSVLLAAYHAWAMALLAEALARPAWIASVAFGRIVSSFYGLYTTGFLWNVFGIKTLVTLAIGLVLLWDARRRNSWTELIMYRLNERLGGRRYQK